jgi:predicted HicB family RNase H-like nuclease
MCGESMTVLHYDIDESVHRRAKIRAAARGVTLRAWIVEAIEAKLAAEESAEGGETQAQ